MLYLKMNYIYTRKVIKRFFPHCKVAIITEVSKPSLRYCFACTTRIARDVVSHGECTYL
jgi:hypothetical protein